MLLIFSKSTLLLVVMVGLFSISACARHTGGEIPVPNIPIAAGEDSSSDAFKIGASIMPFEDLRSSLGEQDEVTSPAGDVGVKVSKAASKALTKRGVLVTSAPNDTQIRGDIIEWNAKLAGGAIPLLESKAAIQIRVLNRSGQTLFKGEYKGLRTSESPIVSKSDIEHSLGIAMSEAVERMAKDERLITVLRKGL